MTQTIVLKVPIHCDACKKKVKKALDGIQGVETIDVDMKNEKVTIVGTMEPKVLIKRLAKIGKKVELPGGHGKGHFNINNDNSDININSNNFTFGKAGNKNKNNLKGKVASADIDEDEEGPNSEVYTHIFSDENANSCSIM